MMRMLRYFTPIGLLLLALCPPRAPAVAAEAAYGGHSISYWQSALKDSDPNKRRLAAYALGQIGPPAASAVADLGAALADRHVEAAWYAADALGRIGPPAAPAIKALIGVIEETPGEAILRRQAVIALGRIGAAAKGALPVLEMQAKSADAETRIAAGMALWKITGRQDALTPVIAELQPSRGQSAFAAALALRAVQTQNIATALVKLLESSDDDVRRAATDALGQSGASGIDSLIGVLQAKPAASERSRIAALTALGPILRSLRDDLRKPDSDGKTPDRATVQRDLQRILAIVAERLGDPSDPIQAAAARALAQAGEFGVDALTAALLAQNARVAAGARLAIDSLEANLPGEGNDADIRLYAKAIPELTLALAHRDRPTRAAGFRLFAMLRIQHAQDATKQALRAGISDPDPRVRRAAAASLARLQSAIGDD